MPHHMVDMLAVEPKNSRIDGEQPSRLMFFRRVTRHANISILWNMVPPALFFDMGYMRQMDSRLLPIDRGSGWRTSSGAI
jgi:hypothetical protein